MVNVRACILVPLLAALMLSTGRTPLFTQSPTGSTVALVNGWWFTGQGFERRTGFSVKDRFTFKAPPQVDRTVDLANSFVVPPFGEAHNHNLGSGAEDKERTAVGRYLADGVFYVKIQGSPPVSDAVRRRLSAGEPDSVDAVFAQGSITASGGHPIPLLEDVLLPRGAFPGYTKERLKGQYYFTVDSAADLDASWPAIMKLRPDFVKTILLFSEEFDTRRSAPKFNGQKGLNPALLARIVAKAHENRLRVSTHVATASDFHHAVSAGVDEIAHLPSVGGSIAAADAVLAAQKKIVVVTTALNSVPSLIRLKVVSQTQARETASANLKLLLKAGVTLAVGSDNASDTSVEEVEFLQRLNVIDNLGLLRMWSDTTPRSIFPDRRIGALDEGFEASFVALEGDPLKDFGNVRRIKFRFKQGLLLAPAKTQ